MALKKAEFGGAVDGVSELSEAAVVIEGAGIAEVRADALWIDSWLEVSAADWMNFILEAVFLDALSLAAVDSLAAGTIGQADADTVDWGHSIGLADLNGWDNVVSIANSFIHAEAVALSAQS